VGVEGGAGEDGGSFSSDSDEIIECWPSLGPCSWRSIQARYVLDPRRP
jgi:hypothetical protein